jgi:hypothetical protein
MNDAQIRIWAFELLRDITAAQELAEWVRTGELPAGAPGVRDGHGHIVDKVQQVVAGDARLADPAMLNVRDEVDQFHDNGLAAPAAEGDFGSSHANTSCAAVRTVSMEEGPASGEGPAPTARTAQEGAA